MIRGCLPRVQPLMHLSHQFRFFRKLHGLVYHILRTNEYRCALMQFGWYDVEYVAGIAHSFTTSCLHNKSHRVALILQAQLALGRTFIGGVNKYTSLDQSAVQIANH